MRNMKRIFGLILIIILGLSIFSTFNAADSKTASNTPTHYNLADYEKETGKKISKFTESPMLTSLVSANKLPSVEKRLPDNPLVIEPWEKIGKYCDYIKLADISTDMSGFGTPYCLEVVVENGHSFNNRIGADLRPGLFEAWSIDNEGKEYTFTIRKGLKWSDGQLVTTEDVEFWYNDVLMNKEITPVLPYFFSDRMPMTFTKVDNYTFKIGFSQPFETYKWILDDNPMRPYFPLRPKHFCKDYHKTYTTMDKLMPLMAKYGYNYESEWGRFYSDLCNQFYPANILAKSPIATIMPNLFPWTPVKVQSGIAIQWERNPYYYMVDPDGQQLPYFDTIYQDLSTTQGSGLETINMKLLSQQLDAAADSLTFEDLKLYKDNEEKSNISVKLLNDARDCSMNVMVNFIIKDDPVLTKIVQDLRFRHALSLALNRDEINKVLYFGLAQNVQYSPPPGSLWYNKKYETAYAEYDKNKANTLLDEMGLKWDRDHKYRLRPDGEKLTLLANYYLGAYKSEGEMVGSYWKEIGVDLQLRVLERGLYDSLKASGEMQAIFDLPNPPYPWSEKYADVAYLARPWKNWIDSKGAEGTEPPQWVKDVYDNYRILLSTGDENMQIKTGGAICDLAAEYLWNIGTVGRIKTVAVYNKDLKNITKEDIPAPGEVRRKGMLWFFDK